MSVAGVHYIIGPSHYRVGRCVSAENPAWRALDNCIARYR